MTWCIEAVVREAVLSVDAAEESVVFVPGPTCGNICLKAAYSSLAGFCEFLLLKLISLLQRKRLHRATGLSNTRRRHTDFETLRPSNPLRRGGFY